MIVPLTRPALTIEVPIMDGLGQVFDFDVIAASKIGNGSGHFEYAVICPGRKLELFHSSFEQQITCLIWGTNFAKDGAIHLSVGVDFGHAIKTLLLNFAGTDDSLADGLAVFAFDLVVGQIIITYRCDFNVQIDSIQQGS